jgi:hypothetical protein
MWNPEIDGGGSSCRLADPSRQARGAGLLEHAGSWGSFTLSAANTCPSMWRSSNSAITIGTTPISSGRRYGMLTHKQTWISAFCVALAPVLLFLAVRWLSAGYQQCAADTGRQYRREEQAKASPSVLFAPELRNARIGMRCTAIFLKEHETFVTAAATVVVAIFTVLLGLFTISLARSTRIAANAAKLSAYVAEQALTRLERPYLFLETLQVSPWEGSKGGLSVEFQFKNFGRTPAIVRGVNAGLGLWEPRRVNDPLPVAYDAVGSISDMREHVIAAEAPSNPPFFQEINIAPDEWARINSRNLLVCLYGEVSYHDVFNMRRDAGFVWAYDPASKTFTRPASPHNYEREYPAPIHPT